MLVFGELLVLSDWLPDPLTVGDTCMADIAPTASCELRAASCAAYWPMALWPLQADDRPLTGPMYEDQPVFV